MDIEWVASELARCCRTTRRSGANIENHDCAIMCDPVHRRVVVDGAGWRLVLSHEGERFAVSYDGDFDLAAARTCALAERIGAVFSALSPDERRLLWLIRQRLADEGRLSAS